jgi:4-diphosphocytidyl-2-C-methyl-D-erythritol kinase
LLVNPGFGVATAGVYKKLRFPLTKKQKINRILRLLKGGKPPAKWGGFMFNRLEEAVLPENPDIKRIKEFLGERGCHSLMSGSGSTVFGVAPDAETGERLRLELKKFGWKSWLVKTIA